VYRKGNKSFLKTITLVFVKTKLSTPKIGFSISKKIGNAVVRNKVKRRMRESFKSLLGKVDFGYNYVFIAREGIEKQSFEEVRSSMEQAVIKAGLFHDKV